MIYVALDKVAKQIAAMSVGKDIKENIEGPRGMKEERKRRGLNAKWALICSHLTHLI